MRHTFPISACIVLTGILTLSSCHKKSSRPEEGPMEVTVAMPEVDSLTLRKTYPGYTEAT